MKRTFLAPLVALALSAAALPAAAGETNIAVAANFTEAAKEIAAAFAAKTGHKAVLSFGSTGQLYTQITQDAPFDVLLAADDERPQRAVDEGLGVAGTVFPYAVGRLVLWSREPGKVTGEDTLTSGAFDKVAIASPKAAPYGAAAVQAMKALGVYAALEPKIVQGNNIAQTFQFVDTGNAEVGFVALSQVIARDGGSRWVVPETLHDPIRQDAVLLKKGADDAAARAFVDFLKGPEAAKVIQKYGYGTAANG
ncbi:molybdate ABC transporter substrate-binding protein [Azospirillum sp. ST 5-10]|uniref:molybdate ABC transporter substrate-binding protein n=1 Tax=unclassified Azospirillum TaxID=2630922 RepID=UPI003F49F2DA